MISYNFHRFVYIIKMKQAEADITIIKIRVQNWVQQIFISLVNNSETPPLPCEKNDGQE